MDSIIPSSMLKPVVVTWVQRCLLMTVTSSVSASTVYHTPYTGCGKKSSPLKFFAIFSATIQNFNLISYSFI